MKRLSIAFLILLMVGAACKPAKQGPFVVTGQIINAPGKKIMLMELPFSSPEPVILDSATLGSKGDFTLRANANEEGIYRLVLENGPDVILINDTKSIRVKMDVNDYVNYTVEQSPASNSLHGLFKTYRQDDSTLLSIFTQLDSLEKHTTNDSLVAGLKASRDAALNNMNNHITSFINETKSPAAVFYAIGLASRTMAPEELKPLADKAAEKYKEHSGIARIKSLLAQQAANGSTQYKLLEQQAPNLTMPDVNGKPISISDFKGKYVLVDFWASWCGPCRAENPNVVAAYRKYNHKNFTILGVSLDEDKEAWKKAIQKDNLTWPHMSDLKMWESAATSTYQFDAIPFNVLIDPQGKIIASALRGEELDSKLAELLK